MEATHNTRAARWAVLPLAVAVLTGCSVDTTSAVAGPATPDPVRIGASATTENELIARLYAGALDSSGRAVELVLGLGDRADRIAALDADRVTLVPERTEPLLHWFEPDARVADTDAGVDADAADGTDPVFAALSRALPADLAVAEVADADVLPLFRSGGLGADDIKGLSVVLQLTAADLDTMVARIDAGEASSADAAGEWLGDHL
ncbi:hypothetical protein [Prescottella subtropica]|uniref:hypothetical protein n=1 Tax=Prescottella subtropica TaxID=2545757 RepID=UPI0010F6F559|nr:hypothetical protein [Prescottella subtropica]